MTDSFIELAWVGALIALALLLRRLRVESTKATERLDRVANERRTFKALIDNSSDFIAIADPNGDLVYVNPAGRRMVGIQPEIPVATIQIRDFYPPDRRSLVDDLIARSTTGFRWSGDTWFRHWQTEEPIPVAGEHFVVHDPSGERILGFATISRDTSEARRAGERLRHSEERFRLMIDEAPIGMSLTSLDGRFTRVNRVLCDIVGYSPDELTRLTFGDITHPDDLDADVALAAALAHGEIPRYQLEKRFLRKDGTSVDVMLSASILRDHDGTALYYIAQIEDITERKRAAAAQAESERRLSLALESAQMGMWDLDLLTDTSVRSLRHDQIFGFTSPVATWGVEIFLEHVVVPEDLEIARRAFAEAAAADSFTLECRIRWPDGSVHWISAKGWAYRNPQGVPVRMLGTVVEITERKRVEQEQQWLAAAGAALSSSLDYEQTLATVADLVVRDFADWCSVEVVGDDARLRRVKVVSRDPSRRDTCAFLERFPIDRSRWSMLEPVLDAKQSLLIEQVTSDQIEAFAQNPEHLRAIRTMGAISYMAVPLQRHGELLGVLGFVSSTRSHRFGPRDLNLAEALAERAAIAIENSRLYKASVLATQARDKVLGFVAHDLRNPLATIMMQATLLGEVEPEHRSRRPIEAIQRAGKRMTRLIQDIVDVQRMEGGRLAIERARVPARQLLLDCVDAQKSLAASAHLELRVDVAPGIADVWADRDRVLQVFENLLGNAIKFTKPGGRITAGAESHDDQVLFWVADNGVGISAEEMPHVFDRFWQAPSAPRGGAGLGLQIVKGIVEAHDGRIWVESEVGAGTTFYFTLPTARAAGTRPLPAEMH